MTAITSGIRTRNEETKIDLTPMLDVVFILLIFFVVTASFLKESALSLASQQDSPIEQTTKTDQNILIQLTQNNTVVFNGERIDMSAARARIAQARAANPAASVIIRPAVDSQVNLLVFLINSAREAGVAEISVIE